MLTSASSAASRCAPNRPSSPCRPAINSMTLASPLSKQMSKVSSFASPRKRLFAADGVMIWLSTMLHHWQTMNFLRRDWGREGIRWASRLFWTGQQIKKLASFRGNDKLIIDRNYGHGTELTCDEQSPSDQISNIRGLVYGHPWIYIFKLAQKRRRESVHNSI